ncbi:unnamed protein product, partial [Rotaria sp. Silwood1]
MENSETTEIDAGLYGQIWSSSDLNPDRLTTEIENLFTKNDSETQRRNDSNTYYNLNTQYLKESTTSNEASASVSGSGWGFSAAISGSTSSSSSNSLQNQLAHTTHDIFSKDDIDKLFAEQQGQFECRQLQVAIIAKQFSVDKTRGAIIRTINTLNTLSAPVLKNSTKEPKPTKISAVFLTGTIQLYAGNLTPPKPWLLCNGSTVLRTEYKSLFSVIGETYGAGDGQYTFNLPDLRGRVPVGVDELEVNAAGMNRSGAFGGRTMHRLTIDQIPSHNHSA